MTDTAINEVVRLHEFFEAWYAGEPGRSIDEFTDALDDLFSIVTPNGSVMSRDEIAEAVAGGFQKRPVEITVENFHVTEVGTAVVCRYDEVQTSNGSQTRRVSTAVLERDSETPGGLRWITVHETWVGG